MEAKLIVIGGDAKATEIKLRLPTIIGRGRGATLTLPHPLVSRQHCEIYEVEGQLHVRDLGSLNGTFIGNEPITEAPLPPGELLTVGAVTFRAIYGELLDEERRAKKEEPPLPKRAAPKVTLPRTVETVANTHANVVERTTRDPHDRDPHDGNADNVAEVDEVEIAVVEEEEVILEVDDEVIADDLRPETNEGSSVSVRSDDTSDRMEPSSHAALRSAHASGTPPRPEDIGALDDSDIDPKAPTDFPAALPGLASAVPPQPQPATEAPRAQAPSDDELRAFLRGLK